MRAACVVTTFIVIVGMILYIDTPDESTNDSSIPAFITKQHQSQIITPGGYTIEFRHREFVMYKEMDKQTPVLIVSSQTKDQAFRKIHATFTEPHHLFSDDSETHVIIHTATDNSITYLDHVDVIYYQDLKNVIYEAVRVYVNDSNNITFAYDNSLVDEIEVYRTMYPKYFLLTRNGKLYKGEFPSEIEDGYDTIKTPKGYKYQTRTKNKYATELFNMLHMLTNKTDN
eukprot:217286_1